MSKSKKGKTEAFSVPIFVITVVLSFVVYCRVLAITSPSVWYVQMHTTAFKLIIAFLGWHLVYAFVEHPFHRYVLHCPLIPGLARFYKSHTLHHGLCDIGYREIGVRNFFPILEEKQHEASFFPWYSWLIFSLVMTGPFAISQWLLPDWPMFLAGCLALVLSLSLYEIFHAIEHWPLEKWLPKLEHPNPFWKKFWRKAYAFHLRHHADIKCNEGISGFFGIPVADFVFGTWVDPNTLYTHGEKVDRKEFKPPVPVWYIRWLDEFSERQVIKRREKERRKKERKKERQSRVNR